MTKKQNLQYKQGCFSNVQEKPIESELNLTDFREKIEIFEEKKRQNIKNCNEINNENHETEENSKKKVLLSRLKKYKAIAAATLEKNPSKNYLQENTMNKNVATNIRKRKMRLFYH